MNHELFATHAVVINASPASVWQVLTTPSIIAKYLHGTETITDWNVGSDIIFQGEYEGHKYRDRGVIQQRVQDKMLQYTYWSGFSGLEDAPGNYSLVTYTLERINDLQTKFSWHQQGFVDETRQQHTTQGLVAMLAEIKALAEKSLA